MSDLQMSDRFPMIYPFKMLDPACFSWLSKENWLVVWNMTFIFPFSWECHHPNWLCVIFFRGVGFNQPVVFGNSPYHGKSSFWMGKLTISTGPCSLSPSGKSPFLSIFHGKTHYLSPLTSRFPHGLVDPEDTGAHMLIFEDFGESLSKIMSCWARLASGKSTKGTMGNHHGWLENIIMLNGKTHIDSLFRLGHFQQPC